MKRVFPILILLLVASCASPSRSNVTNYQKSGNLATTKNLGCIQSIEVKNSYTPADLFSSSSKCAKSGDVENSARLFLFARVYGSYDMSRVSDKSAHQGVAVLAQRAYMEMGENSDAVELEIKKNLLANPQNFKSFCNTVKRVGKPNYHPTYMINHGMSAVVGEDSGSGLIVGFDESKVWSDVLSKCV